MNIKKSVVLFIPVSSTSGIGEYSRSLIIAEELNRQLPEIQIHFLLNRHAKCSQTCPFEVHLSEGSATKDTVKVKSVIDSISPDLVIFDCAGRASHFKYAKKSGAKVIFISQGSTRQRRCVVLRRRGAGRGDRQEHHAGRLAISSSRRLPKENEPRPEHRSHRHEGNGVSERH